MPRSLQFSIPRNRRRARQAGGAPGAAQRRRPSRGNDRGSPAPTRRIGWTASGGLTRYATRERCRDRHPAEDSRPGRGQKKSAEAGCGGELIVVIAPTKLAGIRALCLFGVDQLRRAGLKIDLQEMEFGTVVKRRTSQSPPDKGGWNVFFTPIDRSIPNTHPFGNPACGPTARPLMTAGPTARASRNCAAPGSTPAILPSSVVSP
jgi:hypothetical protein